MEKIVVDEGRQFQHWIWKFQRELQRIAFLIPGVSYDSFTGELGKAVVRWISIILLLVPIIFFIRGLLGGTLILSAHFLLSIIVGLFGLRLSANWVRIGNG